MLLSLILAYVVCVIVFAHNGTHYPYGDGPEYVVMTESFLNHGSPDMRQEDIDNYLAYFDKNGIEPQNMGAFLRYRMKFEGKVHSLKGYYQSTTDLDKWFSYHFWLYSLLVLPFRYFFGSIQADIQASYLAFNLFVIFTGIWIISQLKSIKLIDRLLLILLITFSPLLWYIDWAHAEVFMGVLVFVALVLRMANKNYWAVFCISLAATQNQTLAILAAFLSVEILKKEGLKIPVLVRLFFCNILILLPPVYYYKWYSLPSLLTTDGTLDPKYLSLKRFWHFFFDPNQGLILGIPLVLLGTIIYLIYDAIKRNFHPATFLLLSIPIMALFFMQIGNWNAGNAVVKRYCVWVAPILIVVFYQRIKEWKLSRIIAVSVLIIISQIYVIFSQQDYNKLYWHSNNLHPVAKYILDNHPSWYNPIPEVFSERINLYQLSSTDSVITYTNSSEQIIKMMVREGSISQLKLRGADPELVDSLDQELNYFQGFAYLNPKDLESIGYDQASDPYIAKIEVEKIERQKNQYREQIYSDPNWLKKISIQAEEWGVSLDEAVERNVDYLINHR